MYPLVTVQFVFSLTLLVLLISGKQIQINIDSEAWAAIIGAVLGTIGAYLIGLAVERRSNRKHAAELEEQKIGAHYRALMHIEVRLNTIFITLYKNKRLLKGISSSITRNEFTVNLPRTVPIYEISPNEIRNNQLLNEWINMELKLTIVNQLVEDFNQYCSGVGSTIHDMQIRGDQLNEVAVNNNIKTIHELSNSLIEAVDSVISVASPVLVITRHLSNRINDKSLEQLINYKLEVEDITSQLPSVGEEFNDDMFKDV
ncbi:MAG: hypothetical protein WBP12_03140 [Candidatus Saccharimonas sp.]